MNEIRNLSKKKFFRNVNNVAWEETEDGSIVIYKVSADQMFKLNGTGGEIWKMLEGLNIDSIVTKISQRYNIEREILLQDVTKFIQKLLNLGLIIAQE